MSIPFLAQTIFKDNVKLVFGDGLDLQIYHDGSNSVIGDAGAGNLTISGTNLHLTDAATGEYFFKGTSNGAVELYYDGTEKFITTSTGIDVTGTVNLDNLTINAAQGTDGQVLTSTGTGVAWEDAAAGTSETAERIEVTVKNVSGGSLSKGTVVHTSPSANPPNGNVIEVIAADYDDSTKMPAIGILNETIANEAEGSAVMTGALSGINTSSFSIGDELYVGNLGTLTNSKPTTAGQLIQKIAVVIKSHALNGLIKIFGAGRSNDVPLPLYIDNTNQRVGIGVASPNSMLHLKSTGDVTLTLEADSDNSGENDNPLIELKQDGGGIISRFGNVGDAGQIFTNSRANSTGLGSVYQQDLIFFTENSARVYVKGENGYQGRVGIGAATPSQTLDVNGNVTANRYYGNTNTNFYIDPNDTTTAAILAGGLEIGHGSAGEYRIEVGEGRTGNGYAYIDFVGDTGYTDYGLRLIRNNTGANTSSQLIHRGTGTLNFKNIEAAHMTFDTSNTERMRIESGGDVGIGTTNPSTKLHVYESNSLDHITIDGNNGDNRNLRFATENSTRWNLYATGTSETGSNVGSDLTIAKYTDAGAYNGNVLMIRRSSGNVGIGTDNPVDKFQIDAANSQLRLRDTDDGSYTQFSSSGNTLAIRQGSTSASHIWLTSAGNVGIGIQTPGQKLDVSGNIKMTETAATTDTDKFVVLDSGVLKYRTGTQLRSDIGAGTSSFSGSYNDLSNKPTIPTNYLRDDAFDSGIGLYLQGGSFNAGTDTVTAPLVIDEEDFIYTKDGGYLRKLIGKTGDQIQIGQGGTGLINSINFLPGTAGNSAVKINSNTVWNAGNDGAGSGLDADLLDGQHASRFFRRIAKATATVGPGWMTVAENVSGRKAGEIIVTDADSGDHAYIRIEWMRSYADSNFTVLNCGGHSNRITGARVLYNTSDNTYGGKKLQVYVTTSSNYEVNIYEQGDIDDYEGHSVVTPVIQNTISGYALHGKELTNLDTFGFAAEEGILSGGDLKVLGTGNGIHVDSAGHASLRLDRASTSYDNNLLFMTNGGIKWRLWQDGTDNQLMIRDDTNSYNSVVFNGGGAAGYTTFNNPIRIGGTGSANELDDYEEGTYNLKWSLGGTSTYDPTTSNFGSLASNTSKYVKIGRVVHIFLMFEFNSHPSNWASSGSYVYLTNLPFTPLPGSVGGNFSMKWNSDLTSAEQIKDYGGAGHFGHNASISSSLIQLGVSGRYSPGYYSGWSNSWSLLATDFPGPPPGGANSMVGHITYYTTA